MEIEINYFAVLVGAIITMGLGFWWYSPMGFGKPWMRLSGINPSAMTSEQKKSMWKTYAMGFIGGLVMVYVLAHVLGISEIAFGGMTVPLALRGAFWVWFGFIATTMLGSVLWEMKPWTLYFINAGYYLVSLLIVSVVLALW